MKDRNLNILLIDDDEEDASLFKEAISEINPAAEVTVLSEWKSVYNYIDRNTVMPHIIFMDYILPGKMGNELAAELHKNDKLKDIPLVLCSGLSQPINRTDKTGFIAMITKPGTYTKLVDVLRRVLTNNIPADIS
jgi:CheY-like chemotaxis protein